LKQLKKKFKFYSIMSLLENIYIKAQVMPARLNAGLESYQIFNEKGLLFMRYSAENASEIIPVSATSSAFIFFFPLVSKYTGIEYENLINIFFHFFYLLSYIVTIYCILKINEGYLKKILCIFFSTIIYFYIYNKLFGLVVEYSIYFISVMLFVPIGLCIFKKKLDELAINILLPIIFILAIIFDQIKDYASLGAVIFLMFFIFNSRFKIAKLITIFLVLIYFIAPVLLNNFIEIKQEKNYSDLYGKKYEHNHVHGSLLWFSAYSGLGFISEKKLEFTDESAHRFIKKKNP